MKTNIMHGVTLSFIGKTLAIALIGLALQFVLRSLSEQRASAHTGSTQSCQASLYAGASMKYSSWGCGNAIFNSGVGQNGTLFYSFDDRRHDHDCVEHKVRSAYNSSVWIQTAQSCGSPVTTSYGSTSFNKSRLFRGGNYLTLWSY